MRASGMWKILSAAALILLGLLGAFLLWQSRPAQTWSSATGVRVVIDPGHGGEDGGAVAEDGTVESAINLDIARRLDVILTFCGCNTKLLRNEDISLHDPEAATIRQKKVSDIHNRVKLVQAETDPRLISIHQNHFSQAKYHGAQVFYANGPLGQPWAKVTQDNLRACLDPENSRVEKPISHDIYLMNHITCPAILVECGFLSNPEEREKLKTPEYQTALATVVAGSYLQSAKEEGETIDGAQSEASFLLHGMRQ